MSVYLPCLGSFFEDLAAGLLPLHLNRNNDRKTPAPPLFRFCGWLVRSPFGHGGASVKSQESSYTTNSFWGGPDGCSGPATGERLPTFAKLGVECGQHPESSVIGRWSLSHLLQRQKGPTLDVME